jgi:signal transduction histidine kinase
VVGLAVVVFGLLIFTLASRAAGPDQDSALRLRAQAAAQALGSGPPPAAGLVAPVDLRTANDVFVEGLDAAGTPVFSTGQLGGAAPALPASLLGAADARQGAFGTIGSGVARLRVYVVPVAGAGLAYIVAGQATRVPAANVGGLGFFIVLSAIPTLLAALGASWLVAGRALRPLAEVAATAAAAGRDRDFTRRLPRRKGSDQVAVLADSFNWMLQQLEDGYRQLAAALEGQRRFVADASHELRTPLTTIQVNSGLLARGPELPEAVRAAAARDIAAESERMGRLVDQLLTLAHADSGVGLRLAPLDLQALVEDVGRQACISHPERPLTTATEAARVRGDDDALRQLLWILVENACRHSRAGGAVRIRLWTEPGWARLEVADDGPGIPPADLERIFERFQRADAARTAGGAGLGLAIARWLALEHGGRVLARNHDAGGASLHLDLPLLMS